MTYYKYASYCNYNYAPDFTNLANGAVLKVYENTKSVLNIDARDANGDSYTFEICGGADSKYFQIDARTGQLSFRSEVDYETPLDGNGDNTYEVSVKVRDCYGAYSVKTLKVEVCDVKEASDARDCIVLEAEDFRSCGFTTACSSTASGGELVRLTCDSGALKTTFKGTTGEYKMSLFAQDENDGVSKLCIYVGGKLVDTLTLDKQSDGGGSDNGSFTQFDLGTIDIKYGDDIYIEAYRNCGEYVRIDKICLEPVSDDCGCTTEVLIANENFESGAFGWNTCTTSYDSDFSRFLGRFGKCEYPTKTFEIPADAESVKVGFDLYVIDSWDGEHMYVKVEDTVVDLGGFQWNCAAGTRSGEVNGIKFTVETVAGPTHLGFANCYDWNKDQIVHVTLDVPADRISGNAMTLTFGAGLDEGRDNESFGIDNVKITATVPCDEDPADASLGGRYFVDTNGDNTEYAADGSWERGVADATVYLLQDGQVVATTQTSADGTYSFTGLEAGTYQVAFEDPATAEAEGYAFVTANVGADGEDSDVESTAQGAGYTGDVTLAQSQHVWKVDAGIADPKTAEIGDLAFLDLDKDGVYTAGTDQVLEGVGVTLYDGAGTFVAATTTLADGSYRFTNLGAGSYQVGFAAMIGLAFTGASATAADLGSDDSDADALTGLTGVFDLSIGESELDIDAGYIVPNVAPVALDDAAHTCANAAVTVDVLANDSDSDGGVLSVSAVGGTANTGGTIYLSGTAEITLADGSSGGTQAFSGLAALVTADGIVFDVEDAFDGSNGLDLEYGEKAVFSVSYEVSDGQGGSDDALVSFTVCGTADTPDEIVATLPSQVKYEVIAGTAATPDTDIAFDLRITGSGDARLDGVIFTEAYCLSYFEAASAKRAFTGTGLLTGDLHAATETGLPSPDTVFDGTSGSTLAGANADAGDNLSFLNYILNQDYKSLGYTDFEIQVAIWEFTDSANSFFAGRRIADVLEDDFAYLSTNNLGTVEHIEDILADALANGASYVPGEGEVFGLIVDPSDLAPAANKQPFLVALQVDDFDCLC